MRPKLVEKLHRDFPKLYALQVWPSCGDGWYTLIRELSEKLESMIEDQYVCATQIKEKFGGLRFYMTCATDEAWDLIEDAEERSYKICEVCGHEGRVVEIVGWHVCLCEGCEQERHKSGR